MMLKIERASPGTGASIMNKQATDIRLIRINQADHVMIGVCLPHLEYPAKKPFIRLWVEANKRQDTSAGEIIPSTGLAPSVPSFPIIPPSNKYVERLLLAVPYSEMYFAV